MSAPPNRFVRYIKRMGAGSMLISIIVHVIIIIAATVWVVSSVHPQRKAMFKGGDDAGSPVQHPVKMSNTQPHLDTLTKRLSVDTPASAVALPDLPTNPDSGLSSPALNTSIGSTGGAGGLKGPIMPMFGFREAQSGGTLVGHLYDLKQTQQHKDTGMDIPAYGRVVDDFLSQHWSESVLNRYYHPAQPIYATQIFIPLMPADGGPKAFGQEKLVEPKFWLIRYRGKVAAPSGGSWRFWGYAGEVCCVAINGKTVLVANHTDVKTPRTHWASPEPPGQPGGSGRLRAGDWIDLREGQFVDIDILIGERGGGTFDCFLLIEKKGESYGTSGQYPLYPIFKLAPSETRASTSPASAPQFAAEGPVWRALPLSHN